MIKYTSNSILAMKISFANLISFYCEKTGADIETVLNAVGMDKRIGRIFMDPGVGYGGSCFPKDVRALIQTGKKISISTDLLDATEDINHSAIKNFLNKIINNIAGKSIAIWGLSFKPNTDDIRFAPSIYLITELLKKNFQIRVYDQAATEHVQKKFGASLTYCSSPYDAVSNTDGLAIITDWNEFKQIDLNKVNKLMKTPLIFDGRNIYTKDLMKKMGFSYFSTGRTPLVI